ncbi:hypothetical protein [Pseudonocardia sp. ICBG601]|uniref:hypothetical protein n=1 Tax=Pseudonocardia sp. ICBG601 TaxID=2846759 RepID=UPI001CF719FC|nr:hypothetical protein [Pseudonocardia sp. ICBG601]
MDWPSAPVWAQGSFGLILLAMAIAAVVIMLPGVIFGAGIVWWAWIKGWEPARLKWPFLSLTLGMVFACWWWEDWLLPITGMYIAIEQAWAGLWLEAFVNGAMASAAPAALGAWWWWHRYTKQMRSGKQQLAGEKHIQRQQRAKERTAEWRSRMEITPLSRGERVILGHLSEIVLPKVELLHQAMFKRNHVWLEIPMKAIRLHMACIMQTGAGKTTVLRRLCAGWLEAAWSIHDQASSQGESGSRARASVYSTRPLAIFLNAKGGIQAGDEGRDWAWEMQATGVRPARIGVFPYETKLDMWRLPAEQLGASLHKLAKTDHRFYDVLQRGLLHLIIDQPDGPPTSSTEFLQRMAPTDLRNAWKDYPTELGMVSALAGKSTAGPSALQADLMLFADLFRSLGFDFDSGRPLTDFDALYISLPGTTDQVRACAKAAVLIELLAHELARQPRQTLFIMDEFSAISGEVAGSAINLVERLRALGGAVIVSAQSYAGLGADDDERERLLDAMGGGMLLGRTQGAEPLAKRFGSRKVGEAGMQLDDGEFTGTGTIRRQDAYLLDPNRLRTMPERHAVYATPDKVSYGCVTPLGPLKRLPSKVISRSPRRALPVAGDRLDVLQLNRGHRKTLAEQIPGWDSK